MVRQPHLPGGTKSTNAIAAAYFRALDEAIEPAASTLAENAFELRRDGASTEAIAESMQAVAELLAEAGVAHAQPRALLAPAGADASIVAPLRRLMAHVHDANLEAYLARNQELSFLANAMLAGGSVYDRPLTVQEAWDAAVGVCNISTPRSRAISIVYGERWCVTERGRAFSRATFAGRWVARARSARDGFLALVLEVV
jgi:hypothetical protein